MESHRIFYGLILHLIQIYFCSTKYFQDHKISFPINLRSLLLIKDPNLACRKTDSILPTIVVGPLLEILANQQNQVTSSALDNSVFIVESSINSPSKNNHHLPP